MSGAFDKLGPHRAALMSSLEDALKGGRSTRKSGSHWAIRYVWCVLAEAPEQSGTFLCQCT